MEEGEWTRVERGRWRGAKNEAKRWMEQEAGGEGEKREGLRKAGEGRVEVG